MDSIALYTEEIDDLNEAAADLFAQAAHFSFKKNSLAIIFTEEDADYLSLYPLLSERWKFPVMGCTSMAMFQGTRGYCDIGISVMLLTADDCEFSVGMTCELDTINYKEGISTTYRQLSAALPSKEKLIITYGGMVTSEQNVGGDDRVNTLNELSGGVPIFGGTAADGFNLNNIHVYCNDQSTTCGQVMALVSGNIHPRFVCINSIENKSSFAYDVTEAKGNRVYRLGLDTFIDALKRENMETVKTNVMADYLLSPFTVTITQKDGDVVEAARSLSVLNHEDGSGFFLGTVPKGSVLSIGIVSRPEVQRSVGKALDVILKKIKESNHDYHTMLCTTCCARFLALGGNVTAETDSFKGILPPSVSLMGMYSNGEYCPVTSRATGKEYNMFHNFSFTILAL